MYTEITNIRDKETRKLEFSIVTKGKSKLLVKLKHNINRFLLKQCMKFCMKFLVKKEVKNEK